MSTKEPFRQMPWLAWAMEIQGLAQSGLAYTDNVYEIERYSRLRDIAAEMLSFQSDLPIEKVRTLFCNESGYQTPKIDTRAAIFDAAGERILLVQEKDGRWSMPGGWVDVLESIASNTVKEAYEEAGVIVEATRILAVQNRNMHNPPPVPFGICKFFVECRYLSGAFQENIETLASGYFDLYHLPNLATDKNTREQIALCFTAHRDPNWTVRFD